GADDDRRDRAGLRPQLGQQRPGRLRPRGEDAGRALARPVSGPSVDRQRRHSGEAMRTVDSDGLAIAYWSEGQGPPVVWLQGLNADHTAWSAQIAAFRSDYRCIAIDNRDVGRSGRATGGYTLMDMAHDARAVLDALGVEDAHVVGLSMGGSIAQ